MTDLRNNHYFPNRFLINCGARSGSTMLVHLLRSNTNIMVHGEVILRDSIGAIQGSYRDRIKSDSNFAQIALLTMKENPAKFLNEILFDNQGRQAVGFKFKWDESLNPHWAHYTKLIEDDKEIKIIHLFRKNLLNQYISYLAVNERGMPTLIRNAEQPPDIEPFEIDFERFEAYCESTTQNEIKSINLYKNHESFSLVYEEIIDEKSNILTRLQEFIGVLPTSLIHGTQKNIKNPVRQVTNYNELNSWYSTSQYSAESRQAVWVS